MEYASSTVAAGREPTLRPAGDPADLRTGLFVALSLLIFALAFAVRFWDLGAAPVWMDEAYSYMVSELPLKTILFNQVDNHPPLFYAVQHLWHGLDASVATVRAPAAIAGGMAVVVVSLAAADLVSRRAGLYAGAYLALSTGHVYFSQDARMYPLLSLGLAGAVWGLAGLAQRPERRLRYGGLYVAGGLIAVYSQVVSLVFLSLLNLVVVLWLVARRRWKVELVSVLAANLVLGLFSLPWLLALAGALNTFAGLRSYGAGAAVWFFDNMVGFPALTPGVLKTASNLLLLALLLFGAARGWAARRPAVALIGIAGLVIYPLALLVLNARTPILENRVFIPCEIAAAILFALAIAGFRTPAVRYAVLALFLLLSAVSTGREHTARVKPEDDPQAFALADKAGFREAPVLTCNLLEAGSAYLDAPSRRVFFLAPGGPVRMDQRFSPAIAMSMAKLHEAGAAEYARYVGDAADTAKTSAELAAAPGVIVLSAACDPADAEAFLRRLGFVKAAEPKLSEPSKTVFNTVWTQLELWRKARSGGRAAETTVASGTAVDGGVGG